MDKLTAMRVFVAVVDENGFAAAADRLGLSRTMVSKHVRDLEEDVQARLLNRTTRRLSLTGTGRVYVERARQILSEIEEADDEAARQSLTPRGRLRVNAPMSFGITEVAPLLKGYMDRYAAVEVELVLNDRRVDLVEEGFDLAGGSANSPSRASSHAASPPAGWSPARRRPISMRMASQAIRANSPPMPVSPTRCRARRSAGGLPGRRGRSTCASGHAYSPTTATR
jgi:DNA-binding transcriptional LysR family regulator